MKILGIETSCDETAISLIEVDEATNTVTVLGNRVHSQIDMHVPHGGVFPMLAKREHAKNLVPVLKSVLEEVDMAKAAVPYKIDDLSILKRDPELLDAFESFIPTIKKPEIDFISVTVGPGLEPALWVGITFAQVLSRVWNIPIVPCHHMEGHILTGLIDKVHDSVLKSGAHKPRFDLLDRRILYPALSLLISGGHTQIILIEKIGGHGANSSYKIVGDTRDDAVGECFDKTARMLGLAYPGGPKISVLAAEARDTNIASPIVLPRPMINTDDLDFSFSGLKTAVLYAVKNATNDGKEPLPENFIKGIAREIEDAITDVLVSKMRGAIEKYAVETLIIGGGVVANTHIRKALQDLAAECTIKILLPQTDHATDNGLMIALAGYFNKDKAFAPDSNEIQTLKAAGTSPLGPRI